MYPGHLDANNVLFTSQLKTFPFFYLHWNLCNFVAKEMKSSLSCVQKKLLNLINKKSTSETKGEKCGGSKSTNKSVTHCAW